MLRPELLMITSVNMCTCMLQPQPYATKTPSDFHPSLAQPSPAHVEVKCSRLHLLIRIAIIKKDLRFRIRIRILVPIYRWCDLVCRGRCGLEEEWLRGDKRNCLVV